MAHGYYPFLDPPTISQSKPNMRRQLFSERAALRVAAFAASRRRRRRGVAAQARPLIVRAVTIAKNPPAQ